MAKRICVGLLTLNSQYLALLASIEILTAFEPLQLLYVIRITVLGSSGLILQPMIAILFHLEWYTQF